LGESRLPIPRVPEPGDIVDGKYRILRLLGAGGMGTVLAAEHLRLRQQVAIKFLNPAMLGVAQIVERFDREARAAATLRSAHVVRVTDVGHTPEGVPYMVMELLEGVDLESERERRGRLPYPEVVDYVLQAGSALAEAHDAGIVHRDLKPANLFLARDGGTDKVVVKVLDFGISKFTRGEDAKLTSAGAVMGTTLYMSPEQIRGSSSTDARSDIWSLGVILYELLAGEAPWTGSPMRVAAAIAAEDAPDLASRVALPGPLAATIHAMLAKRPEQRPQSIQDLVHTLAPFAAPGSIGAEAAHRIERRSQRDAVGTISREPSTPWVPDSDRLRLVVSSTATPDRSTMAATSHTSVTQLMAAPKRALWPLFAAAGALLTVVGVGGAMLALQSKHADATVAKERPASASVAAEEPPAAPAPKAAELVTSAETASPAAPASASAPRTAPHPAVARPKRPPTPPPPSSPPPAPPKSDGKSPPPFLP
jgi:serine/threonine-protein kinase